MYIDDQSVRMLARINRYKTRTCLIPQTLILDKHQLDEYYLDNFELARKIIARTGYGTTQKMNTEVPIKRPVGIN
jgi:hypothetical protein